MNMKTKQNRTEQYGNRVADKPVQTHKSTNDKGGALTICSATVYQRKQIGLWLMPGANGNVIEANIFKVAS